MGRQVHITVPTIRFTHRYPRRRAKVQIEETLNLCASRGVPVRREQPGEEDAMLITLPRAVAPGPVGATLLTIDGRLAAALVVAVAAIAAGIFAQALHGWLLRRRTRAAAGRTLSPPTRRAA